MKLSFKNSRATHARFNATINATVARARSRHTRTNHRINTILSVRNKLYFTTNVSSHFTRVYTRVTFNLIVRSSVPGTVKNGNNDRARKKDITFFLSLFLFLFLSGIDLSNRTPCLSHDRTWNKRYLHQPVRNFPDDRSITMQVWIAAGHGIDPCPRYRDYRIFHLPQPWWRWSNSFRSNSFLAWLGNVGAIELHRNVDTNMGRPPITYIFALQEQMYCDELNTNLIHNNRDSRV